MIIYIIIYLKIKKVKKIYRNFLDYSAIMRYNFNRRTTSLYRVRVHPRIRRI